MKLQLFRATILATLATVAVVAIGYGSSQMLDRPVVAAEPVAQQISRWEGACARCGASHTWLGSNRPFKRNCDQYFNGQMCNGAIIWQPIYQ